MKLYLNLVTSKFYNSQRKMGDENQIQQQYLDVLVHSVTT
ncbi:hypothetical protein VCRA2112O185_70233 [Vibrio crassostreae]|nr:hypothetical protein VCRA2112O185_70233 [Vibrio crassostreae]CAK3110644.1 hypothetical protein VCRA2128O304_40140 [Vibrio crassostreae]